jgi:hypothetical protein
VFPSIVSPTAAMVTDALFVLAPGPAPAWPAVLLARGLAGPAAADDDDAAGDVPVPLAE